jgi:hypothetical protein
MVSRAKNERFAHDRGFDAQHAFEVAVRQIRQSRGLGFPGIPNDDIWKAIGSDFERSVRLAKPKRARHIEVDPVHFTAHRKHFERLCLCKIFLSAVEIANPVQSF